jgi:hypothetical protein
LAKALVLPADDSACGRFRLLYPARAIRQAGGDVAINRYGHPDEMRLSVIRDTSQQPIILGNKKSYPVVGVKDFDADVLVMQRPATQNMLRTIQLVQKQLGKAVVVDIDDALWNIHPKNLSHAVWQDNRPSNWRWLLKCCRAADLVTVTTKALQDKVGGVIIPNCIPDEYLEIKTKKKGKVAVGWGGTITTHPDDLQVTNGAVAVGCRDAGARFIAVGGGQPELNLLEFEEKDDAEFTGPIPIDEWPKKLAGLDVSIVPLADSQFNHGKSWLKSLESCALGSVPIMSPTPDNLLLHERGVGVIAKRPRQWRSQIIGIVLDDARREELGSQGREAAGELTFSKNAWLWEEAWDMAVRNRGRKAA